MSRNSHRSCSKKSCSQKFPNIHRKTPVLGHLFNEVVPTQVNICKYCQVFENNYFEEHMRTAASEYRLPQ